MRSLAVTAVTLTFMMMSLVTFLALRGDPMGGEPRLLVKIPAPDSGKLQPSASFAPASQSAPATTADVSPGTMSATQDQLGTPTRAPVVIIPPADDTDNSGPGIAIRIPQ